MDNFATDLDKVLDEFEYKDDRTEHIPSVPTSIQVGLPSMSCNISNVYHQAPLSSGQAEASAMIADASIKSEEISRDFLTSNIHNLRKSGVADDVDSINHFYTHDGLCSDKLQHKQCMNVEGFDPSNLTIHNDISQKLLQKRLNDNINNQTMYDVKLSQPNLNPSASGVYNSFNSYINAPSIGNCTEYDITNQSRETYHSIPSEGLNIISSDSFSGGFVKNSDTAPKFSIDDLLTVKEEDLMIERKDNSIPPKYQNILLPVKVGPCKTENSTENAANKVHKDLNFPDLITGDDDIAGVANEVAKYSDKIMKSLLDDPEHVYENVYIGTDIPKNHENSSSQNIVKNVGSDSQHTYENITLGVQNVDDAKTNKVYESICSENRENMPDTNIESEIASMKITEHHTIKDSELHNKSQKIESNVVANVDLSSTTSTNTKLVFQNVQLDPLPHQIPDPKPIVGFTTIDDMSEEELSKYLADLEAEEREKEMSSAVYQNIQVEKKPKSHKTMPLTVNQEDEDANEAPIFEAVTIGELPQVPQEDLQEKAKKFPVIDYSQGSSSGESSRDFPSSNVSKMNRISAQVTDDEVKKSKKIHEKIRKSSDNTEPISLNTGHQNDTVINKKDEENGNILSTTESADTQNKIGNQNITSEANKNLNNTETVQSDNIVNKNLGNSKQNINTKNPVRSTETISRFSVTRNVDVNDKLGSRSSRSTQPHNKYKKPESCAENTESSDDDPNKHNRPHTRDVTSSINMSDTSSAGASFSQETSDIEGEAGRAPSPDISESNSSMESGTMLGKQPPFWVPDSDAPNCMLCDIKFTVMKRRHHCRACGKVLCSKCCNMKYRLEYQSNVESRVCVQCHQLLTKAESDSGSGDYAGFSTVGGTGINSPLGRPPNPNNPMEYCSTIPPLQQLAGALPPPPTVMVPVGVLKREGSSKQRSEGPKSVMFSDGIRPGCDLTELDSSWDWKPPSTRKSTTRRLVGDYIASSAKRQNCPPIDPITNSYIPSDPSALPPTVTILKGEVTYHEIEDVNSFYNCLKNECEPPAMLAINRNLYAYVKIINLNCCVNKICWNVTSKGLACVGQDEVVFLVETLPDENEIPKDLLLHINQIYHEATKGNTVSEYGMSIHQSGNLLGSREHAGFLFIRQTLQCLQKVIVPPAPFLVGLLVHRWETPWAKVFPLRLVLRLGAEYRYYPCPLMSVRFRDAVYFEIGHTIMKVLADFRNFAYTLPKVQGLTIHMQDRTTNVRLPKNRYNQVIQGLNNSNDHVLAFAANFSIQADTHLVCMQTNSEEESESTYQTQAINIQNKPRKVTGASFIVINGALKSSMGLSANSSILEDGLMVQIMPEKMEALKAALKNMQDFTIGCGRQGASEPDEIVNLKWVENDTQFNIGVKSPIDGKPMDGIPSIRVHNGVNFVGTSRFIRWTEVFIIKSDDDQPFGMHYPVDINKLSESIARATCAALVKLLDLLANAGLTKIAVRTNIHPDNVGYEAGSEGTRLPPIYMNSLDNELIQVLQKAVQGCEDTQTVLELIFYVLETEI